MTIVADGPSVRAPGSVPGMALVVDPADQVHVDIVEVGPGKPTLIPVLVLPGGTRLYIDPCSTDDDAADWWTDLVVAASFGLLCYQGGREALQ